MKKLLQLTALLLACLTAVGGLAGCAQLSALSYFFAPQAPATTVTTPSAGKPSEPSTANSLSLYYDERVEIVGQVTGMDSQVTQDDFLLDVVAENTEAGTTTLRATGVGTAKLYVSRDGTDVTVDVKVSPAPLSLFFVLGEEDALGSSVAPRYPIKASDGLVYYSVAHTNANSPATASNAAACIPTLLSENHSSRAGGTLFYPTNALTTSGEGRYAGFAASFAYKWNEQTGERVWIINAARRDSRVTDWKPQEAANSAYATLLALFAAASDTLDAELAAGHYDLSRMGYLFSQGESDNGMAADAYIEAMKAMHQGITENIKYTAPNGEKFGIDFGGMIACRATRTPTVDGLRMNGPRSAQHYIANATDDGFASLYMLANAVDYWHSDASVAAYFARYDSRAYRNFYGYAPPATVTEVIDKNGAYTDAARNELGAEAAENLLYITGKRENTGEASVALISTDGVGTVGDALRTPYGVNFVSAVPVVSPIRLAKLYRPTLTVTDTEGKSINTYYIANAPLGKPLTLKLAIKGVQVQELTSTVRYNMNFAFNESLPRVAQVDNKWQFSGYSGQWTCGYVHPTTGSYTAYSAIDSRFGWLYDGTDIWGGHGGVQASNNWKFGPLDKWDAAYAFTAPQDGTVSFSFNGISAPINDYYFAIFLEGKMVWPTVGATPDSSASYFTVSRTTTLEEMNDAVANATAQVKKGQTIVFVCRRSGANLTAEGSVHPVVRYLD